MVDCLFCRIAAHQIPADILYENENLMAFRDVNPKAPFHVLIIPKKHITGADHLTVQDGAMLGEVFEIASRLCSEHGISNGYRVVSNVGADGGQSVAHLHFHILGGRPLAWPPG